MPDARRTEPIPGRRAVHEALRSGRDARRLFIAVDAARDEVLADILDLAARQGIEVERVAAARLGALASTERHQGVVLMARSRGMVTLQDVLSVAVSRNEPPLLVCLDGIEDPQNLGAIARSAVLAGAHGLVLPERGTAQIGPGAIRAAAGALSMIAIAGVSSLVGAIPQLQRAELYVVGADSENGRAPWETRLTGPLALVIGSEHAGLSPAVKKAVDASVRIPTPGGELSLNVNAAAAVLLFERVRQVKQGAPK